MEQNNKRTRHRFLPLIIKSTVVGLIALLQIQLTCSSNLLGMGGGDEEDSRTRIVQDLNLTFKGDYNRAIVHSHKKVVVCYVGTWATYRTPTEDASFDLKHIEPQLCTHLIYSFAGLDNSTYLMKPLDPWLDQHLVENGGGKDWYTNFNNFKLKYPHLKVLLAIGGWNEGSKKYSDMAASPAYRATFIQSALDLIRKYGFDGLDLDWEFPGDRGGSLEDKRQFTILVQELRHKFDKYGLMLTSAFGPARSTVEKGYELRELSNYLDHIHLMCYDFNGAWDRKTGHNAPLRADKGKGSVEDSVNYYLEQGVPPNKLVVGIPFYGRTFILKEDVDLVEDLVEIGNGVGREGLGRSLDTGEISTGLGKITEGKGFQGPFTKEDGFLGYNEIVRELMASRGEWTTFWDDKAQVPFMRNGRKWVTFENPDSVREKIKFIASKRLRGAMIWSIDTDDFKGYSSSTGEVRNPLLRTINYSFYNAKISGADDEENSQKTKPRPRPTNGVGSGDKIIVSGGLFIANLFLLFTSLFVINPLQS